MKLSLAQTALDRVAKKGDAKTPYLSFVKIRRLRYIKQRDGLNMVISELEQWQRRFDPSWFLILRIADPLIDQELAAQNVEEEMAENENERQTPTVTKQSKNKTQSLIAVALNVRDALRKEPRQQPSIFLPFSDMQRIDIPFSPAQAAQRGGQWFIVERYSCQIGRNLSTQNDDVRTLARKLASADPWTFGLLNCKGVMKVIDGSLKQIQGFDFVFRLPDSMEVLQSLRQNLLSGEMHLSLSRRVLIAKELAKSVSYVHNFEFVHKHICPETVLLFEDLTSRFSTFLVGFDNFRSAEGGTNFSGDERWERNLYRHPSRQGEFPEETYKMQHDLYSLGVCLLEIGLWKSFVSYSSDPKPIPQYGDAYLQFTKWLESTQSNALVKQTNNTYYQAAMALKLKEYFVQLAETQLPNNMGDKYSEVVVTCLTCLDKDNEDFGDEDEASDGEGILMAIRFIEKILLKLNEISV